MAPQYKNGPWKNPATGKFNVMRDGKCTKTFDRWEDAMADYRGLPPPGKPVVKHGVIKSEKPNSVRYHVWYEGTFYGVYQFELSANQKFAKVKESNCG